MANALHAALQLASETGYLHLSYMGLTSVPEAVFSVRGLVRLDLSHNELIEIPTEIGNIHGLEELWLNDNPLKILPSSLERCLSLRIVDLRDTELSSLPRELCVLSGLTHLDLTGTRLPAQVLAAYAKGGTPAVLSYLAAQDARRDLNVALSTRLSVDVYREASDTANGKKTIARIVEELSAEFSDNAEMRTVIRNAERLLPLNLYSVEPSVVRARYLALQEDNARKALGADIELALRAIYYNALDVRDVEGMVKDIMGHMHSLEDAQFLVKHAKTLFPPRAADVSGARILASLVNLRERMAAYRKDAIEALFRALQAVYPDREPKDVLRLCTGVAALIAKPDDIRSLAADAGDVFPAEFGSAKPKKIAKAFEVIKREKGL